MESKQMLETFCDGGCYDRIEFETEILRLIVGRRMCNLNG